MLKSSQAGRSMIEMLGVLGIISVIATSIITVVSKVFDKYKQSIITTQIRDLQKNIRTMYSATADYRDLSKNNTVEMLIKERAVPPNMVMNGKLYHAYGGAVELTGTQYTYSITFKAVKREGCIDLLGLSWTVNDTSDLIELITPKDKYNWTGLNGHKKLPITGIQPYSMCDEDRTKNDITWVFQ